MYLLDSTHCIDILDAVEPLGRTMQGLRGASAATCAIVRGELVFMAMNSRQREQNLLRVAALLRDIVVYPVDDGVAEQYGILKAAVLEHFGPRDQPRRRKTKADSLGFKDNDLWIAATAKRHGLTVLSSDSAFQRMAQVGGPPVETWLPPDGAHRGRGNAASGTP